MIENELTPANALKREAMSVYTPPFKYVRGYIYDANMHMVSDDDGVKGSVAARIRGWGKISYMPNASALQDELGRIVAQALTDWWHANSVLSWTDIEHPKDLPLKAPSPTAYSTETRAAIAALFDDLFTDADAFYGPGGVPLTKDNAKATALSGGFVAVSGCDNNNHSLSARLNDDHTVQCCHGRWIRGDIGKITNVHM